MSSALNLIIARGFSGTGASDVGNAMRGEQDRQMARDSEQLNQAAAVFNQQQAQRQAEQRTRDQAMLDSSRSAFEPILSRIGALEPRLIAMQQSGQMDPALIAEAQALDSELKRTALSAQAKLAPQSVAEMLIPRPKEQATQEPQGPSFGNVNPSDYTPASLAKFAQTQNYGDLVRQYAPTGSGAPEKPPSGYRTTQNGDLEAIPGGPADVSTPKISGKDIQTARTKRLQITAARNQLRKVQEAFSAARGASAGPLSGLLPTESGRAFDAAVNQLRQLQTAVTRVPGVGAMSDYENRLANAALPSRNEYESVTQQQIDGLNDLLNLLDQGYAEMTGGASPDQPKAPQKDAQPRTFTTKSGTTVTISD